MKRKAEDKDLTLEQKVKRTKLYKEEHDWKRIDDPRIDTGCVCIWIHWNKFLEPLDSKTPPYRVSLTGPRVAAENDEPTHHYTCTCEMCESEVCCFREDEEKLYQWKLCRRDRQGEWSSTETAYNIDPWWTNWTIRQVLKDDLYWFQFTINEQFVTTVRQGFPNFMPNVLLGIILRYVDDRPKNPLAKLKMPDREEPEAECECDWDYRNDNDVPQDPMGVESVDVFFDPAVLINIEKS